MARLSPRALPSARVSSAVLQPLLSIISLCHCHCQLLAHKHTDTPIPTHTHKQIHTRVRARIPSYNQTTALVNHTNQPAPRDHPSPTAPPISLPYRPLPPSLPSTLPRNPNLAPDRPRPQATTTEATGALLYPFRVNSVRTMMFSHYCSFLPPRTDKVLSSPRMDTEGEDKDQCLEES